MSQTKLEKIFESNLSESEARRQQSLVILEHSESFKLCEDCESISFQTVDICPVCQGYRFSEDIEKIKEKAIVLGRQERMSLTEEDFI